MPILDPSEPEVDRRAPPTVRRSALGCTKLRDSCHACATSKIKCSREKPSCSKCEARGIECQYFLARRPGRRREGGSAHPTSCTSNSNSSSSTSVSKSIPDSDPHGALSQSGEKTEAMRPTPQHGYTTNGTASSASLPTSNGFLDTPQSLMTEAVLTTDNLLGQHSSDLSSVLADSNMSRLLSDFDPNPNGIDFGMTDYFEHPAISNDEEFSRSLNDIESLLIPKTTNFGLDALDSNEPLTTSFAMSSGVPSLASSVPKSSVTDPNIRMIMHTPTTDMSCGCVTQALDLLKTLSSAQSSPVSSAAGTSPALSSSMAAMGSAQTVLIENKHHIQTVSNLLSCSSCTEDAFRLVIASMIVPKILERYASVARAQALSSRVQDSAEIITGPRPVNSTLSSRQQRGPAEGAEPYIHHDSGR